jgi:uncharacterized protein YodC (DUF2158 family)
MFEEIKGEGFIINDLCCLKSGGPVMKIINFESPKEPGETHINAVCEWYDSNEKRVVSDKFPVNCLMAVHGPGLGSFVEPNG